MVLSDLFTCGNASNVVWRTSVAGWLRHFPWDGGYEYRLWSDAQADDFVRLHCHAYWATYNRTIHRIHKADLLRYCLLYRLGGVYSDLDYEPRANFEAELAVGRVSLIGSPYMNEKMENSLMASPVGNDYWLRVLDLAILTLKGNDDRNADSAVKLTGPGLLRALPDSLNTSLAHILPCKRFFRATHKDDRCWTSTWAAAKVRKHQPLPKLLCPCAIPLQSDDARDASLLGVHWGTYSYSSTTLALGTPTVRAARFRDVFKAFHNVTLNSRMRFP